MPKVLIVEKSGIITEKHIKKFQPTELYKVAGFKTSEGFKCFTTWNTDVNNTKYCIQLFAKSTGRANHENKYEFPPPVDSTLFFGNCVLVNYKRANGSDLNATNENSVSDLTKNEWKSIYEYLYGGFEDIGDEDSELSDDDYDDRGQPAP
jgi:hypothetical protein